MKRASILYFSDRGGNTARRIGDTIVDGYQSELIRPGKGELSEVTGRCFAASDVLIFVGSCGIAVRAIAPYVVHKASDPAVIVCDELGIHVISLLSGHIGGANELTKRIAERIGADPVITTATDINHRFSVDTWAAKNGLFIDSLAVAKRFSAEILRRDLPFESEYPINGALPNGIGMGISDSLGLRISTKKKYPFPETLLLVPKIIHIGIGCKRDTPAEDIRAALEDVILKLELHTASIADISSIDIKKDEVGIIETAGALQVPFLTYSAEELNALSGDFSASAFVQGKVGVDCVCERACVKSAGTEARLIMRKTKYSGITCAVACEDWRVTFE